MVDVNKRVVEKINRYWEVTSLPRFPLLKEKSWAYEKDGAKIYFFSNPEVEGIMLVAIFKGKGASLEYSVVDQLGYHKTSYDFYDGVVIRSSHFDTEKKKVKEK